MLHTRFGLFPGRSPLLGESLIYFLFLEVLRCFSSLRSPPYKRVGIITLQVIGLSHSEIPGSMDICSYPGLIAAYHVLRRLREPRHPPCALSCFPTTPPSFLPPRSKKELRQEGGRPYFQLYSFLFCRFMSCDDWPLTHHPHKGETRVTVFLLQSCLCQHVKDL